MQREIRVDHPDDLAEARAEAAARLSASPLPQAIVPAVAALARAAIQANYRINRQGDRPGAPGGAAAGGPGDGDGLRRGHRAAPRRGRHARRRRKLRALGLQNPRLDPGMVVCVTLLVALMVGMVGVYLARYFRSVYDSDKLLLLLSLLAALSVLGLRLGGMMLGARLPDAQFGYVGMLCVATAGMLIAALIHPRLALVIAALLAAQSGLILGNGLRFSLMTLLSSLVAIYAVSDIRSRGDVLRAGALLGVTNALLLRRSSAVSRATPGPTSAHLLPGPSRRGWSPWRCSGCWRPCSSGPSASRRTSACWNCPTRTGPCCSGSASSRRGPTRTRSWSATSPSRRRRPSARTRCCAASGPTTMIWGRCSSRTTSSKTRSAARTSTRS